MEIGKVNKLTIRRIDEEGAWLGDWENLVLLPKEEVDPLFKTGLLRKVFVYKHPKLGLVCTLLMPEVQADEVGFLEVVQTTPKGILVDLGNNARAMIPNKETKGKPAVGMFIPVLVKLDEETELLIATQNLFPFLQKTHPILSENQCLDGIILNETKLGYQVLLFKNTLGLLYHNEIFQELILGQKVIVFVKKIREDGQIDLSLRAPGYNEVIINEDVVMNALKKNGGVLNLGDYSTPQEIYDKLGLSKKTFKKIIGGLYKNKLIDLGPKEIKLIK